MKEFTKNSPPNTQSKLYVCKRNRINKLEIPLVLYLVN